MKALALAVLLTMVGSGATAASATADATADVATQATPPSMRARLSDDVIRQAVRATLAEQPSARAADRGAVLSGDGYKSFARQMDEAEVPSCWRPDAMKHQPPKIGPIGLGGIFALPFWGAAILSGKCNK